jgi:ketosteroid isomerase-like protein
VYMPSPYNTLVKRFLRALEAGEFDVANLTPLLAEDAVLHVRSGPDSSVDIDAPAGVSGYFTQLREASGGTLVLTPRSFELKDRVGMSVLEASGTRDGEPFTETLRLVLGLAGGRVKELWVDPVDTESFAKALGV